MVGLENQAQKALNGAVPTKTTALLLHCLLKKIYSLHKNCWIPIPGANSGLRPLVTCSRGLNPLLAWGGELRFKEKGFNMNKYVITLLATSALVAGCNQSVETASQNFNELPPAVQKTVRAQAPNGEIANVSQKTENGAQVYQVEFRNNNGANSKVLVAADGTLVGSDLPKPAGSIERALTPTGAVGTPLSALPEAAQKTIKKQAPDAPIANISRHEDNGRTIYEVEFKDQGKNPTIKVAEDGQLVQSLQK
jgi:uncharacterized membrane protein YkoI